MMEETEHPSASRKPRSQSQPPLLTARSFWTVTYPLCPQFLYLNKDDNSTYLRIMRIRVKALENYLAVSPWESHFLISNRSGLYQELSRVPSNSNLSSFLKLLPQIQKKRKGGTVLDKLQPHGGAVPPPHPSMSESKQVGAHSWLG